MNRDPFDILRDLAAPDDRYLAEGVDAQADHLLARVVADPPERDAPHTPEARLLRFPRRRAVVVATTLVAVMGGSAVAAVAFLRRPADPVTLVCYSEAAADPSAQVGLRIDPTTTAVEQCARLWLDGTLGTSRPSALVACVTDRHVTAVVPAASPDACEQLGWTVAPPSNRDERLDQTVADRVPELFDECIPDLETARGRVEALLVDLGADDRWNVVVTGSTSADRPCAANIVDATNRVVDIVALQPPPG